MTDTPWRWSRMERQRNAGRLACGDADSGFHWRSIRATIHRDDGGADMDQFSRTALVEALKSPLVLFTLLVAGVAVAASIAFRIAGPAGMGVLGLLIAFIAQRVKLEQDGAFGGGGMNASLAAMQVRTREQMTGAEREAHAHETRSLLQATSLATIIGLALAVVGIGAWFLG
jgi:hypothetical protein